MIAVAVRGRRTAFVRRVLAGLAALLAVLLAVPPVPALADDQPGTVRFEKVTEHDPEWILMIPNLIYRSLHSRAPYEVSYDTNVGTSFIPDVVPGKALCITTGSINNRLPSPRADGTVANTNTAIIQLLLFDSQAKTFQLVGWDLRPLRDANNEIVDWRAPTSAGEKAASSLTWDLSGESAKRIQSRLNRGLMHSEPLDGLVTVNFNSLASEAYAAGRLKSPPPVRKDLLNRTFKVSTEQEPCTGAGDSSCRKMLETRRIFPNVEQVVHAVDDPPTGAKRQETLRENKKHLAQKFVDNGKKVTGDASALVKAEPFNRPGNSPVQSAAVAALNGTDPGGIDFSTLQLRYLNEGAGGRLQYSFAADSTPGTDHKAAAGKTAVNQSSDAFFVWLSLPRSTFWVNLNPTEPDRIVDPKLGATDVGRVLLQADFRMKTLVGRLIHPDTALGKEFWGKFTPGKQSCISLRQWIVPKPAAVYEHNGGLYIVDAPLEVKMEADYLKSRGGSSGCAKSDDRMVSLFRSKVLPKVEENVNKGADFADLRRVYLSRVAAEWYREKHTDGSLAGLIDSGDVSPWPARESWSSRQVFDAYVKSYNKKEFNVHRVKRVGDYRYDVTYSYGGVDFSNVDLVPMAEAAFSAQHQGLTDAVAASAQHAAPDRQGKVWLGGGAYPVDHHDPLPVAAPAKAAGRSGGHPWIFVVGGVVLLCLIIVLVRRVRRRA
ncbi:MULTISPECIES: hypothetical protein [unclassified Streptomyces]|uniref:hypothetical protein n=1 Tax=unclassified Streptomyces TaxID=2593676 RepID=UPI00380BD1F0